MNFFSNLSMSRLMLLVLCGLFSLHDLSAQLTSGEYFFDTDPGVGKAIAFSIPAERYLEGEFTFDTEGLEAGMHILGVRVMQDGFWGLTETVEFYIEPDAIDDSNRGFLKGEYFIDDDPGIGLATSFDVLSGDFAESELDIDLSELSAGEHVLGVRFQNADKVWSMTEVSSFTIEPEGGVDEDYLTVIGYKVFNSAGELVKEGEVQMADKPTSVDIELDIDISGLTEGDYLLQTYAKNETGLRGHDETSTFSVIDGNAPLSISLSNTEVEEKLMVGTVVGSFSSTDDDAGDSHTYTLVTGEGDEDNASFTMDGDELKTAEVFDFTQKSTYSVRVRSTDLGELFTEQVFAITVIDAKEAQTITFTDIGIDTYGDAETLSAVASSGLEVTFEISDPSIATVAGNELSFSGVGEVIISAIQSGNDTYREETVTQTIQVSKALLSVRAEGKTRTYGDENPLLTLTYDGFVNDDNAGSLTEVPQIATEATVLSPVGDYSISLSGGQDDNYNLDLTDGQLTITKATLTLTADDQTRVYGESDPELSFSYAGFVNGEDESDLDSAPVPSTTATVASDVGSYPITFTAGTDRNYAFELVDGELSVTRAEIIAEVADATRNKGEDNPEFIISYTGFVNGDGVSDIDTAPMASTTATSESDRGTYDIVLSGGSDNNYSFNLQNGVLTVTGPVFTLPVNLDFGEVNSGESKTESVVIENTGDGVLKVSSVNPPPGFAVDQTTFDLGVSESMTLMVTFSPTEGRAYSGNLVITSNDGSSLIPLNGEGMLVTSLDDEVLDDEEVNMYPNPASTRLIVDLTTAPPGPVTIRLTDINGQERLSLNDIRERRVVLDISAYQAGIYILKVESRKGTVFRKVMIER